MSNSAIDTLRLSMKTALEADAFISNAAAATPRPIPILTEDQKNISYEVESAVKRIGILATILTFNVTNPVKGGGARLLMEMTPIVQVQELVVINRGATGTGQPAILVAEAIAWALHGHRPAGWHSALMFDQIQIEPDSSFLIYNVIFDSIRAGHASAPTRQ